MNHSCHFVILDLHNPSIHLTLTAKKGDTGRTLKTMLTDNGSPYIISSDCYAVFTARKPDGNILYNACEIADNVISYTFTAQTCAVAGSIPCEIRLYGSDGRLITAPAFTLVVEDTLYSDGDIAESAAEVSALTDLISRASSLISDVEQQLSDNAYADAHSAVCFTPQSLAEAQQAQARANIAAAPAGFGLGTIAAVASDPDIITETGFYAVTGDKMPTAHWWMGYHIRFRDEGYDYQWFYDLQTGCAIHRYNYVGEWQEWEWETPRMIFGIEYRTAERWNGKVVYAKLLELGTLPNSTYKDVEIGAKITALVDLQVSAFTESLTYKLLPISSGDVYASVMWGSTLRVVSTSTDSSAYTAQALIKYTKD